MTKPDASVPAAARPQRQAMTVKEQYYYSVLLHWYRHRPGEPPSMPELAAICRPIRSGTAVRTALLALESKGYVRRNRHGKFEVCK